MFMGIIQDRDEKIGIKNSEIIDMKPSLRWTEKKSQGFWNIYV